MTTINWQGTEAKSVWVSSGYGDKGQREAMEIGKRRRNSKGTLLAFICFVYGPIQGYWVRADRVTPRCAS